MRAVAQAKAHYGAPQSSLCRSAEGTAERVSYKAGGADISSQIL